MMENQRGTTVLITKGVFKGYLGEYVGHTSKVRALVKIDGFDEPANIPFDSLMVFCSHNEEEEKEVEFEVGDKVVFKEDISNTEFTVMSKLTESTLLVVDNYGCLYGANVDALELVEEEEEEPTVDADEVFDSVALSTLNMFERLSTVVTCEVSRHIDGLGYDTWATTVLNIGVDQYVESLFGKYFGR